MKERARVDRASVAEALAQGFIAAPGTRLRREDETKVDELVAMLEVVGRAIDSASRRGHFVLVDAAAGKGYVGVLAAHFLLRGRSAEIVLIEREASRIDDAVEAAGRLGVEATVRGIATDVDDAAAYPPNASLIVALHACGDATDRVLDAAIARNAARLLLVPCCVGKSTRGSALAEGVRASLALPSAGASPIARRLVHAIVDGERILRLEAAGYATEALEFVPTRVTPYNVMLRARRVGEPVRSGRSAIALARLRSFGDADEGSSPPDEPAPPP